MKQQLNTLVKIASLTVAIASMNAFAAGALPEVMERPKAPTIERPGEAPKVEVVNPVVSSSIDIRSNVVKALPEFKNDVRVINAVTELLKTNEPQGIRLEETLGSNDSAAKKSIVDRIHNGVAAATIAAGLTLGAVTVHAEPAQQAPTTCSVEAFMSEYTNGLPNNVASMFRADQEAAKREAGFYPVIPGNCGKGSSAYGVTARTNLAMVLHGQVTAHKYDINALQNSYKVTMNTSDSTAKTAANDFVNGCKIVQVSSK